MKLEFLKKLNAKVIAIAAAAAVFVVGGGTAIALAATSPAPENPELSEQEAKAAVFSHAGVSEQDVLSLWIDKGVENGSPVYEIDFTTAEKSYDYDIVRSSGEILHSSYDVLGAEIPKAKEETKESSSQAEASSSSPASSSPSESGSSASKSNGGTASQATQAPAASSQAAQPSNNTSSAITKDQAKSIALKDAGVSESATQFVWVKEDYDDGRLVYEVEFYANGTEYDYDIDQATGRILSSDFDIENYSPSNNNGGNGTVISVDKARSIALAKVPGASANDIRIHLDRDDGRQIYEGEIYYNRMEYEFEIDASTGTIIEWSAEHWD